MQKNEEKNGNGKDSKGMFQNEERLQISKSNPDPVIIIELLKDLEIWRIMRDPAKRKEIISELNATKRPLH